MTAFRYPALGLVLALAAGCADPNGGREEVSGTVTLGGTNLDRGYVMFVAVSPDHPTQASASITDGSFRIPKPQGLAPGKYKVTIDAPDGKTPDGGSDAAPGPTGNFASKNRVPPEFNTNSTLEVEVKAGGPNTFEFRVP